MNSPDHTDRLFGLHHNQRPQPTHFFPVSDGGGGGGGGMPSPGGPSTTTCTSASPGHRQQQPQLSSSGVDPTTSSSSATADDMNELSKLLVLYNHDLDRVQRHLEGALQHTQAQSDQLQLNRKAPLPLLEQEARKQQQHRENAETSMGAAVGDQRAPVPQQEAGANGASLMDSLAAFVGGGVAENSNSNNINNSSDGGGSGPQASMMHLPNQSNRAPTRSQQDMMLDQLFMTAQQQQQPQRPTHTGASASTGAQSDGRSRGPSSSSSPGILSYSGTIKTALGPSSASGASSSPSIPAPSSSLLGMAAASSNSRSSCTATGNAGDKSASASSIVQANFNGPTNVGPTEPSALYGSDVFGDIKSNSNNSMAGGGVVDGGMMMAGGGDDGLALGCLTPPTHPSAHGQGNSLQPPSNVSAVQQNAFQQQQQPNFSIGPSALMAESLTTPSPFGMSSVTSTPMPQTVLRSQSVGSVQSAITFASAGSTSSDLGNNTTDRASRVVAGGGFLGPGRALGPGGIGIKRAKRSRGRSDGGTSSSIDIANSMTAKSNIQALLRQHASIGGKQPNAEGMCPIHIACRDYATNARLIGTMLCTSPGVGRLVVGRGSTSSVGTQVMNRRPSLSSMHSGESSSSKTVVMEGSYPIHIALANSPSVEVVTLLVRQNPELLIKGDGTNRVPLSMAFSEGASLEVLDLLLVMNPNAAAIPDLRNNYPLHLACARRIGGGGGRINLNLLRRLVEAYPAAVHKRNFNGKTPLELAQDGGLTDDDAISYLHEMAYMERDDEVIEAPDA